MESVPTRSPAALRKRRHQQVHRVPGVRDVERLEVRHPAEVRVVRVDPVVGDEPERAPVVGERDLVRAGSRSACACRSAASRASSLPATATTSRSSPRTTLIAATPKPPTAVTPSAISWNASSDGVGRRLPVRPGRRSRRLVASMTFEGRRPAAGMRARTGEVPRLAHVCGVFGVWAPGEDVAKLTYFGLYALQHRGQESAGIAVSNGRQILVYKDMGLVSQVFDETTLDSLKGHLADRPRALLDDRRQHLAERAADVPPDRRRLDRAGPQRQPDQHPRARADGRRPARTPTASSTLHARDVEALDQRHRPGHRAAGAPPGHLAGAARARGAAACCEGAFSFVWMNEDTLYAARDPAGHPAAGPGPARPRLGGRLRGRRAGHHRRQRRPRDRARRADRHRRARPAHPPVRRAGSARAASSSTSTSPAPTPPSPASRVHAARVEMGRELARQFPVEADLVMPVPESGTPAAAGLRRGERHPVRPGLRQERLRRPHLHPAQPDPAPARHPAQAQRPRAHGPRQEARRRRRLDRPRQHPARPGPDAPRGRRPRGARADLLAAGEVAVLLRHRLRHPRRADRQRPRRRGDPRQHRRRQPRLHLARRDDRGDRPAEPSRCARPASPASTRSRCPTRACSASTCSRPRCPHRPWARRSPCSTTRDGPRLGRLRRGRGLDRGRRHARSS